MVYDAHPALPPQEIRRMVHDLTVHQIELELQNEELRSAQTELDISRARYFDLYNLAPVGYMTIGDKGLILEANLTAVTLLGSERVALVPKPITRYIHNEDQDIYYLHRKKLFETGKPQSCELRMLKQDGTVFWASLQATAVLGTGSASLCRVVMSDITDRKQIEEELRLLEQQRRQLRKAESLNCMAGAIAHHFNNAAEAYGDSRGTIHLTLKTVSMTAIPESNRSPVNWRPKDPVFACMEVKDSGCGIGSTEMEKIFDPFFSTKFPGRGLGLPVILGIVRVHDGAVAVESEPNRGSVFRIFFPLSSPLTGGPP